MADDTSTGKKLLVLAVLCAVTLVAYGPALDGEFIWDDDNYVEKNDTLRDLDGLRRMWLEPRSLPQCLQPVQAVLDTAGFVECGNNDR